MHDQGLRIELGAYKCFAFLDWLDLREDEAHPWGALCDMLSGHGVSSLHDALQALRLKPAHDNVRELLSPRYVKAFAAFASESADIQSDSRATPVTAGGKHGEAIPQIDTDLLRDLRNTFSSLLDTVREFSSAGHEAGMPSPASAWEGSREDALAEFENALRNALSLSDVERAFLNPWPAEARRVLPSGGSKPQDLPAIWATVLAWAAMRSIGLAKDPANPGRAAAHLMDELRLREPMAEAFESYGLAGDARWQAAARVRVALAHASWAPGAQHTPRDTAPFSWMNDPEVAWLLGIHEHEGVRYLVKEPFEELLWWLSLASILRLESETPTDTRAVAEIEQELTSRIRCAAEAGYRVDGLFEKEHPEAGIHAATAEEQTAKLPDNSGAGSENEAEKRKAARKAPKPRSRK